MTDPRYVIRIYKPSDHPAKSKESFNVRFVGSVEWLNGGTYERWLDFSYGEIVNEWSQEKYSTVKGRTEKQVKNKCEKLIRAHIKKISFDCEPISAFEYDQLGKELLPPLPQNAIAPNDDGVIDWFSG